MGRGICAMSHCALTRASPHSERRAGRSRAAAPLRRRAAAAATFARRKLALARFVAGGESVEHLIEKPRRQKAVVIAVSAADFSQIIAAPQKLVAFGDDDPRALVVESEMAFDG